MPRAIDGLSDGLQHFELRGLGDSEGVRVLLCPDILPVERRAQALVTQIAQRFRRRLIGEYEATFGHQSPAARSIACVLMVRQYVSQRL